MKTSTSETSMVALPSGFTNRTNEPNTSPPAEPKFSHEFVAEQLILIINSPDCTNELKKAAATMLVENEAKHRQVRSTNKSVSSDPRRHLSSSKHVRRLAWSLLRSHAAAMQKTCHA